MIPGVHPDYYVGGSPLPQWSCCEGFAATVQPYLPHFWQHHHQREPGSLAVDGTDCSKGTAHAADHAADG
jgi:hypothetical protein